MIAVRFSFRGLAMKVKVTSEIAGQVWKVVASIGDALAEDCSWQWLKP